MKHILLETAKLAKNKGFNWEANAFYGKYHDTVDKLVDDNNYSSTDFHLLRQREYGIYAIVIRDWNASEYPIDDYDIYCPNKYSAPYQAELQEWLRDVHNIQIEICYAIDHYHIKYGDHDNMIQQELNVLSNNYDKFSTYEDALENALLKSLKMIK